MRRYIFVLNNGETFVTVSDDMAEALDILSKAGHWERDVDAIIIKEAPRA